MLVAFATRLLNAGHPLHASAPPAPLHCPPPGHEPEECSGGLYDPAGCRGWMDPEDSAEGELLDRPPRLLAECEVGEGDGFLKLVGLEWLRALT